MLPADLPAEYAPAPASGTIPAGSSHTSNGVVFSCAAGGDDCMVTVAADGTVSSTGGMVTATLTQAVADIVASRNDETTRATQRTTANMAITAAQTAAAGVNNDSTDAAVSAAETTVANARTAVNDATALTASERAELMALVNAANTVLTNAKTARQTAMDDARDEANMAMAATAAKLYEGISEPTGNVTSPAATDRAAAYNATATAVMVSAGLPAAAPAAVTLSEDKKTTVAANHGWAGKRYTRTSPASDGMYEAIVYSNVEAPKDGRMFGSSEPGTGNNRRFEYTLANGVLTAAEADGVGGTGSDFIAARVGLDIDRTAGVETFRLPSPNPSGADVITDIDGSYHGVDGTYSCEPATPADGCSATVAARGFTLGGGTWTFRPGNANARVIDMTDSAYASYGWWIHKTENDKTYTASVFVDERGTEDAPATGLDTLNGTATYMGGAAGKYSLTSRTGGTNDAGHFTARATLEANFTTNDGTDTTTNAITGTIDNFIGADGQSRDWEVDLRGSPIADTGGIGDTTDGTVWTIGGTASAADGQWSGTLRSNGTDGVPQVATGTFYSTYGTAGGEGRMIGAFGANKQ